jgi:hypothetical protein
MSDVCLHSRWASASRENDEGKEDFRCDDDDDGQLIRFIFTW